MNAPAPIPGRPEEIYARARRMSVTGSAFAEVATGLRRLTTDGWHGEAANRFRDAFGGEPLRWERAGQAFAAAARALNEYADSLTWAQERALGAIEMETRAQALTSTARAEHEALLARLASERERARVAWSTAILPLPPSFVDPGAQIQANALAVHGDAVAAVRVAGDVAAVAVREACRWAPEKPNWLQRASGAVGDALGFGGESGWGAFAAAEPVPASGDPAALVASLGRLRAGGVPPSQYRDVLQAYWYSVAGRSAGVDLDLWLPGLGADALRPTIEAVYTYYGRLFLENPHLQWAGMANMIGPSFAAGFFDLDAITEIADRVAGPLDELPGAVKALLPTGLREIAVLGDMSQDELRFYETSFLEMQKEIFVDQAVMHEAYLAGGLPAIEELGAAGIIDADTVDGWRQIEEGRATGDQSLLDEGNTALLYREQRQIIDDNYTRMLEHKPSGAAFTYLMTAVGEPSIPGAQGFAELRPLEVSTPDSIRLNPPGPGAIDIPLPGQVTLTTPLPDGNLAVFDDRWDLIERDTLPAYQRVLMDDPAVAAQIIGTNVADRIEANRLERYADDVVRRMTTGWDVRAHR